MVKKAFSLKSGILAALLLPGLLGLSACGASGAAVPQPVHTLQQGRTSVTAPEETQTAEQAAKPDAFALGKKRVTLKLSNPDKTEARLKQLLEISQAGWKQHYGLDGNAVTATLLPGGRGGAWVKIDTDEPAGRFFNRTLLLLWWAPGEKFFREVRRDEEGRTRILAVVGSPEDYVLLTVDPARQVHTSYSISRVTGGHTRPLLTRNCEIRGPYPELTGTPDAFFCRERNEKGQLQDLLAFRDNRVSEEQPGQGELVGLSAQDQTPALVWKAGTELTAQQLGSDLKDIKLRAPESLQMIFPLAGQAYLGMLTSPGAQGILSEHRLELWTGSSWESLPDWSSGEELLSVTPLAENAALLFVRSVSDGRRRPLLLLYGRGGKGSRFLSLAGLPEGTLSQLTAAVLTDHSMAVWLQDPVAKKIYCAEVNFSD